MSHEKSTSPSGGKVALGIVLAVAAITLWAVASAPESGGRALSPEERARIEAQLAATREAARLSQERLREAAARTPTVEVAETPPEAPVTLSEYERVQPGMSLREAVGVLGEYGNELSRSRIPGLPLTVMYGWENPDGSNMSATFQDGSLIHKSQVGLR